MSDAALKIHNDLWVYKRGAGGGSGIGAARRGGSVELIWAKPCAMSLVLKKRWCLDGGDRRR